MYLSVTQRGLISCELGQHPTVCNEAVGQVVLHYILRYDRTDIKLNE